MRIGASKFGLVLLASILFLSCGGSSDSQDVAEVDSTAVANESNGMTMVEAAVLYPQIVHATNCAMTEYSKIESKYNLGNSQLDLAGLSELTSAFGRIAAERQKAVEDLVEQDWPNEIFSDIEALALYWAGVQRREVTLSKATDQGTWNEYLALWIDAVQSSDAGRSKIIRIKLGIKEFSSSECN
jgi:hypothetical protein